MHFSFFLAHLVNLLFLVSYPRLRSNHYQVDVDGARDNRKHSRNVTLEWRRVLIIHDERHESLFYDW